MERSVNIIPPIEPDPIRIGDIVKVETTREDYYLAIFLGIYPSCTTLKLYLVYDIDRSCTRIVSYNELKLYAKVEYSKVQEVTGG